MRNAQIETLGKANLGKANSHLTYGKTVVSLPTEIKKVSQTKIPLSPSKALKRQSIALISIHGDPAVDIGKEEAGGQNVYVRSVGEYLANFGWQVDMFTRKIHPDQPTIVQHSSHCRTIRLIAGPETFIPRDQLFDYIPQFLEAFLQFEAKESTYYPLIHTNYWLSGWVGLQLQKLQNIQLVHTYHSVGAVKYQNVSQIPPIAQTRLDIEREILLNANCVVATSPQEKSMLESMVAGGDGNIKVIPCGTNLDKFHFYHKDQARSTLGFNPEDKIVLYAGRFDPRKGIETLVRAGGLSKHSTLDQFKLVIVGGSDPSRADGKERQRIEEIVNQVGLTEQTIFPGQLNHDILPLYYAAADICVVPSYYEPFGLVAIEAMACGTPVIASAVGGLQFTVIPQKTGFLFPPRDEVALAKAIDRIFDFPLQSQKLGHQAAIHVRDNFSWEGAATQLTSLYRSLLAQSILDKRFWSLVAVG